MPSGIVASHCLTMTTLRDISPLVTLAQSFTSVLTPADQVCQGSPCGVCSAFKIQYEGHSRTCASGWRGSTRRFRKTRSESGGGGGNSATREPDEAVLPKRAKSNGGTEAHACRLLSMIG
jgi:hypothetical protein